jgi:hypothetical protein
LTIYFFKQFSISSPLSIETSNQNIKSNKKGKGRHLIFGLRKKNVLRRKSGVADQETTTETHRVENWQWPLDVHSILTEKFAQAGEGGGARSLPLIIFTMT